MDLLAGLSFIHRGLIRIVPSWSHISFPVYDILIFNTSEESFDGYFVDSGSKNIKCRHLEERIFLWLWICFEVKIHVCVCVFYMPMCVVYACASVLVYLCACGGQRLATGIFPNLSPSHLWKQDLSLDLELTVGWLSKGAPGPSVSASLVLGLRMHTMPPEFLCACWESELNSSSSSLY